MRLSTRGVLQLGCAALLLIFAASSSGAPLGLVGSVADGQGGVTSLDGANSASVTPDGRHVYVAASLDDALVVFARNPRTGSLTLVEEHRDGVGGDDGLDGANGSVTSPDGRFVYVTGGIENALAVFARDSVTGSLDFVEVQRDGVAGVNGLDNARAPVLSPDGSHLYVGAYDDDAVAVFSRNLSTGRLSFVQAVVDGVGGVDGLDGCNGLAISPDGAHLYAIGEVDDAVTLFTRNPSTGALGFVAVQTPAVNSSGGIALSPDAKHVYVSADPDSIVVFARDAGSGALTFVEDQSGDLGAVGLFQGIAIPEEGDRLYVASFNTGSVATYSRDATTGEITFIDSIDPGGTLAMLGLALTPDGRHVYAVRGNDAVYALATAVLRFVQFQQDGVASVNGLEGASGVAMSPDGRHLYVSGASDNALALFDFDAKTGAASFVQAYFDGTNGIDGLAGAFGVVLSPDGAHLYAVGFTDGAVAAFARNPATGALAFVEAEVDGVAGVDGLAGAIALSLSPDGRHLYVAAFNDAALSVFSRNPTTGALTFEGAHFANASNGLVDVTDVTVSPDGANVYTAAFSDDAVTTYARNPTTGALTSIDLDRNSMGGVTDLDGANAVTVTPDGLDVFAVAGNSSSLVRFARSGVDGSLSFVRSWLDGVEGIDGLSAAADVTPSRDGRYLFTASLLDDAIAVFSRDASSGAVAFVQFERDGVLGVGGLDRANTVRISPDGRHVFVTATDDDALVIFAPEPGGMEAGSIAVIAVLWLAVRYGRRSGPG